MDGSEHEGHSLLRLETRAVGAGLVGGLLAGIPMGLVLQFGTDLLDVLAGFLGSDSVLAGWVVHLMLSLLAGVVFVALLSYPAVASFMADFGTLEHVLLGVTYASMIAAVSVAILPFVPQLPGLSAAGSAAADVPSLGLGGLVPSAMFALAHLVYGALLGGVYAMVADTTD